MRAPGDYRPDVDHSIAFNNMISIEVVDGEGCVPAKKLCLVPDTKPARIIDAMDAMLLIITQDRVVVILEHGFICTDRFLPDIGDDEFSPPTNDCSKYSDSLFESWLHTGMIAVHRRI